MTLDVRPANPADTPGGPRHRSPLERLDAALGAIVDYRALVPLRIAMGLLVLMHLRPMLADSAGGVTYRDTFHVPVAPWYPEVPEAVYIAALWLAAGAAVLLALGLFTRTASIVTAIVVVYNLLLTQTHYHHNRAFLAVVLVWLTLMPVGERISLDARLGRTPRTEPGWGPRWPLLMVRFQVATVYAASGISKLLDPDWISGVVLQLRVESQLDVALSRGVPAAVVDVAASSSFQWWFAKVVVATEIFIGLGLLWRRTRWAAVWIAIPFHVAIELSAEVELFSYAGLAALVIWVSGRSGDRTLTVSPRWARVVRALDWTGRFAIDTGSGSSLADRDGSRLEGRDAGWRCATLLPATFWLAAPWQVVRRRRRVDSPEP